MPAKETEHTQAARRMLECIEKHGGLGEFIEKLASYPEQYLLDLAISAAAMPDLSVDRGKQYFARDSNGQWYYINHANTWQTCPPPFEN